MSSLRAEPSLGQLLGSIVQETGSLVRQEVALARTELKNSGKTLSANAGIVLAGGAIVQAALLSLAAALVIGLRELVPPWLSALGCGMTFAAVGYGICSRGMRGLSNWSRSSTLRIPSLEGLKGLQRPPSNDIANSTEQQEKTG